MHKYSVTMSVVILLSVAKMKKWVVLIRNNNSNIRSL